MERLTTRRDSRLRLARALGIGATVVVAATALAADAGAATPTNRPIGTSGSVAALSGSSMEVQNPFSGQTTVSWTSSTTFSKTVNESVSSLAAGDCIVVTGTPSKTSKTTIAARSVNVTMPSSTGACTGTEVRGGGPNAVAPDGGFRTGTGGGEFFGTGGGGTRPTFPKGAGPGNFRRLAGSIAFASGKVTTVSGSTITVSGFVITPGTAPGSKSSKSTRSSKNTKITPPKTETLKITTSGSTPVSATQQAASTDLAVGDCVSAVGPASSNGSVTATTVHITSTGGGSCMGGFARFGGGGAFFGAGPGGGGA
jgi:hypothetical protein